MKYLKKFESKEIGYKEISRSYAAKYGIDETADEIKSSEREYLERITKEKENTTLDIDIDGDTCIIETTTENKSVTIYIDKKIDEWFIVGIVIDHNYEDDDRYYEERKYYLCDQIDGLVNLLKKYIN